MKHVRGGDTLIIYYCSGSKIWLCGGIVWRRWVRGRQSIEGPQGCDSRTLLCSHHQKRSQVINPTLASTCPERQFNLATNSDDCSQNISHGRTIWGLYLKMDCANLVGKDVKPNSGSEQNRQHDIRERGLSRVKLL